MWVRILVRQAKRSVSIKPTVARPTSIGDLERFAICRSKMLGSPRSGSAGWTRGRSAMPIRVGPNALRHDKRLSHPSNYTMKACRISPCSAWGRQP
jgi:hypothetical protein